MCPNATVSYSKKHQDDANPTTPHHKKPENKSKGKLSQATKAVEKEQKSPKLYSPPLRI
jgi:hypothetical protein